MSDGPRSGGFAGIATAMILLTIFQGCRKEKIPADVIAMIGTRMITNQDFRRYLERNPATELAQIPPEAASALLDQYAEEILLSEFAATRGIEIPTDRIADAVRNDPGSTMIEKRDQMRRARLMTDAAAEIAGPAESEIRAYYDANPPEFEIAESVHVRHIMVHDRGLGETIVAELRRGGSFEDLSEQHSAAPNAARGGDIGFVTRGELPQVFEDVIFHLALDQVSDPVETGTSFHIFKVEEVLPEGQLPFERAAPLIEARLQSDAMSNAEATMVADARRAITATVLIKRLPFAYSGTMQTSSDE